MVRIKNLLSIIKNAYVNSFYNYISQGQHFRAFLINVQLGAFLGFWFLIGEYICTRAPTPWWPRGGATAAPAS